MRLFRAACCSSLFLLTTTLAAQGPTGKVQTASGPGPVLKSASATPCSSFPTPPGMVAIRSGTFPMGSDAPSGPPYGGTSLTQPVHQVVIRHCFWMGATEVTQEQYSALMGATPSFFFGGDLPVESVSWFDALAYCAALTAQQSALGRVPPGFQYRLPTEAEWEYACRAGTTTEFNVGPGLVCSQARFAYSNHSNSSCASNGTMSVASHAPNAWGLFDMHGNVWEWCLDSFSSYSAGPLTDPYVPYVAGGPGAVCRGGSWFDNSMYCRSAERGEIEPGDAYYDLGFRVVLAPILVP